MFFVVSKVLWFFAAPMNVLLFAALVGLVLTAGRHARLGRALAGSAIVLLILIGVAPVGPLAGVAPLICCSVFAGLDWTAAAGGGGVCARAVRESPAKQPVRSATFFMRR